MIFIFLGPPGSGKGTQAVKLAQKTGLPHIPVGDMLREVAKTGTELAHQAEEYMNKGMLVPDEMTIGLVKERLSKKDCDKGFILDGFPRSQIQAEALDEFLVDLDYHVIYIDIGMNQVIERNSKRFNCKKCNAIYNLSNNPPRQPGKCDLCGGGLYQRSDDSPEVIRNRYTVYMQNTQPLVDFYSIKKKLIYIPGEGGIEEVFLRLTQALRI